MKSSAIYFTACKYFFHLSPKNQSYAGPVRYNDMIITADVFDMCDNGRFLALGV